MVAILCALFFVSGAAALLFETLWFRQAGLTFGNTVWASAIVLSSFMAGLALGNGLAARFGERVRRPLHLYALLEVAIAVTGVALVWGLPNLTTWLVPVLRPFLDQPWVVNTLRLLSGFMLLLVPATAMGATLPILVRALLVRDPSFGATLGRLYGWNTLGAVVGALAGEALLLEWIGVRGSAVAAAAADLGVAVLALALAGRLVAPAASPPARVAATSGSRPWRLVGAAFLAGGILLALEIVWFRFLHLFAHSGSLAFSVMLAVVLAGIGLGGLCGGLWLRRDAAAFRHAPVLALLCGVAVAVLYTAFPLALPGDETRYARNPFEVLRLAVPLMLPVALGSGILFTWVGTALHSVLRVETRAAGVLTLANTTGAGLGSLAAGFVLLPGLGMERSFFLLAALYGAVALLLAGIGSKGRRRFRPFLLTGVAAFALALILFPFGLMERRHFEAPARRYGAASETKIAAVREGRTETLLYLRKDLFGQPLSYRLLTDGFGMSATEVGARRYMKLYVYCPVALRPDPRTALLISYGLGNTAKALTDTPSLERIDVVDISREILELSRIVFPEPGADPLSDPRVHVYVEDGRYFLETTRERYDLITGEPPPPKNAGTVNLYTREFFQLVYDRLAPGGVHTYWLPVHNLLESDTRSIIRAYCDVFADCSLWMGHGLDWMLVGSREAAGPPSEEAFARQWEDPVVASELRALGLELPEQLGALFLADARSLAPIMGDASPLVDDFPKRLANRLVETTSPSYFRWMDAGPARDRFRDSEFVRRAWPDGLRRRTLPYFELQDLLNRISLGLSGPGAGVDEHLKRLHALQTGTPLRTLVLWELGSDHDRLRNARRAAARGARDGEVLRTLGLGALADREFDEAARHFRSARESGLRDPLVVYYEVYALRMAGRTDEAGRVATAARDWLPGEAAGILAGMVTVTGTD
jgi:predicted membrane-bound spermidine synthase